MSVLIQAAIVFAVLSLSASDIHFPKDMRTDVQFPPIVKRSDSGLPDGHLRPLGYQKKPEARVKEYQELLAPREFWEQHVQHRVPLVYRQAVVKAPAFTKWQTDDYIREKYGDLDVLIEKKVESRDAQPQQMPLKEFLDSYEYEDWYVMSLLPDPMREEMMVPRSILCGTFRQHILESNLWISAGGTSSVLHYDADHNLHCLLSGRKDFILIHPKYADQLDLEEKRKFSGSGYSTMNMDMINIFTNPHIAKIPWTWATLRPGDCIFIPSGYFQQVRSYGRSMAGTIMWSPLPEFDDSDCATTDIDKYTPLSQVNMMWTYKKGDKVLAMRHMDPEVLRAGLLTLLKDRDRLRPEHFEYFYEDLMGDKADAPRAREIFGLLDQKKKGFVSMEEIKDMDVSVLKNVARHLDSPHGPVKDHDHSHDEL
ncbi:bifunctional peptidase and arginyl-hydroxylase JMJD5-like [Branchiostoma floridae]|uniref:Bifunctional peptidase and arginyl-hydroxylase JMJD5-like n=1 Tax=Branchiostoma floridae TaxID=7739 RepID=A0A9J7M0Q2_BRAFL|nr:bifunctional peptidase and arginyl-hydroxylase JMJD5-like [Branchiostoma floridae]